MKQSESMRTKAFEAALKLVTLVLLISCGTTNRLTKENQRMMFTAEQIQEKLSLVRTGADFPALAMNLKNLGVTYYETRMEDGQTTYHGDNGFELQTGPNYQPIIVADKVNPEQLKEDIVNHQQGRSDYFQISQQSADNGIEKWAVCLTTMTCTYMDKSGNEIWVERIPDPTPASPAFTLEQLKAAHSKVKSGADFPAYIREIKAMGVTHYQTYVADGRTDYHGTEGYSVTAPPKYEPIVVADIANVIVFKSELLAHQQGKTDFLTFINMCAETGIANWEISMEKMTCTYFDAKRHIVLVEQIPQ